MAKVKVDNRQTYAPIIWSENNMISHIGNLFLLLCMRIVKDQSMSR